MTETRKKEREHSLREAYKIDLIGVSSKLKKYLFSIPMASFGKKKTLLDERCSNHGHLRLETDVLCTLLVKLS